MCPVRRIILTRAQEQSLRWEESLTSIGIDVLILPLIRYSPTTQLEPVDPGGFDWILFTSPQGVRSFFMSGFEPGKAKLGVLGEGTAKTLAGYGFKDDLGVRVKTGAELASVFCRIVESPARILLPGPAKRLSQPTADLKAAGFSVKELPLYKTEAVPPAELPENPFKQGDMILFASPSAVKSYAAAYKKILPCVVIGETTAHAARDLGFDPVVAEKPDLASLCRAAGLESPSHLEDK